MVAYPVALVVDDDPVFRELAGQYLADEGFSVLLAEDGDQGIKLAAAHAPHIIVTDMMMPNRDGIELILAVRLDQPAVPIVAVTSGLAGISPDLLLKTATGLGADAALGKPLKKEEFIVLCRELISRRQRDG